jgi:hypothetical protein
MGLTPELSRATKWRRLGRLVSDHTPRNLPDTNRTSPDSATARDLSAPGPIAHAPARLHRGH